ncbi:MAG: branched-chain amino acid ABC transporter permease [Candidatus Brennerbacteria bacterium]|nr:branched-chain amino acid ABC transporter permease [Candidatus Brennerbacteria bacterium]
MEYLAHLAVVIGIYGILTTSLNLVSGYAGLVTLSHGAFYAAGAYAVAILTKFHGVNFFAAMVVGALVAAVLAAVFGVVLSRFRGDYYLLVSIGVQFIATITLLNWQSFTNGPFGISGIARPAGEIFQSTLGYLLLTAIIFALVYIVARHLVGSPYGRVLKAIREDEEAIRVFGYRTEWFKHSIYVMSAMMAALAGALFAAYFSFIDPWSFAIAESILILVMVILGGLANLKGSLLGAVVLVLLPEFLRFVGFAPEIAAHTRLGIYGLLLILLMLYRPQGLIGEYKL